MSSDSMNSYDSSISRDSLDTTAPSRSYKVSEYFPCAHQKVIRHKNRSNCFSCGLFLHDNVKAYKSPKMKYGAYFDPSRFYSSTIKVRQPKIVISQDSEFYKCRNGLLDLVWETSAKLKLTPNTMHLAVMFMDLILSKNQAIPQNLFQVYAATSVMIAAKSIELDERIPFISKLQSYSGLKSFNAKEFAAAEIVILKELSWNLQCVTTIDILEYFLSQGVVFSSDAISEENTLPQENALREKVNQIDIPLGNQSNNHQQHSFQSQSNNIKPKNSMNIHGNSTAKSNYSSIIKNNVQPFEDQNQHPSYQIAHSFPTINGISSTNEKENKMQPLQQSSKINSSKKFTSLSALSDCRIFNIVQKIENDYLKLTHLIARESKMRQFDLMTLTGACVCFLRGVNGLSSSWNEQLSVLTNRQITSSSQIQDCLDFLNTLYQPLFNPNKDNTLGQNKLATTSKVIPCSSIPYGMVRDSENENTNRTPNKQQMIKPNAYSTSASGAAKQMASDSQIHTSATVTSFSALKQFPMKQPAVTSHFTHVMNSSKSSNNLSMNFSNKDKISNNNNNNSSSTAKLPYNNYQHNSVWGSFNINSNQNTNNSELHNNLHSRNNHGFQPPLPPLARFGSTAV